MDGKPQWKERGADTFNPFKSDLKFTNITSSGSRFGSFPSYVEEGLLILCTATTRTTGSGVELSMSAEYYDLGNLSIYGTYGDSKCTAGSRVFYVKNVPAGTTFSFDSAYAYAYGYKIVEIK